MHVLMTELSDYRGPTQLGSHAFAREFAAAGADVMWLGTPIYPHTFLGARDSYTQRRCQVWNEGGRRGDDGITEYYPFTLLPVVDRPFFRTRFAARNTLRATLPRIETVLRERGFATPDVAWFSMSRYANPASALVAPRASACRLSDDWAHFRNVPLSLQALHDEVVDAADAVFVTSRRHLAKLRARRPDAVYLPNGVSEIFFHESAPEPEVIARYPHPRIVFVGQLDEWVDFDCIAAVGERNPAASVLVVGPGEAARRPYPANVHFLGGHPYAGLPALLRHCDVGIVPFVPNELTHAVSPLKLYEYFATGLAVVATRLDEIEASESPAVLCDSHEEFARAVTTLSQRSAEGRAQRVAFARQHTWRQRFGVVRARLGF